MQKSIVYEADSEEEALRYEYALITLMSGSGNLTNYGTKGVLPTYKRTGRHVTSSPPRPFQLTALAELVDDVLDAKEVARILKVHRVSYNSEGANRMFEVTMDSVHIAKNN